MKNVTNVLNIYEDYTTTLATMIGQNYTTSGSDSLGDYLNKIKADVCCMHILEYVYPMNLAIAQIQTSICNCGISNTELQKVDEEWDTDNSGKPEEGQHTQFKEFCISKLIIMVADT